MDKENLKLNNKSEYHITSKEFYRNPSLFIYYPDYDIFKRTYKKEELFNKKEFENVNRFIANSNSHKKQIGAFYHCRKLGITTKYDKELYDSFNLKALLTLLCCLIPGKLITSASLEKKNIKSSQVVREYFKITSTCLFIGFLFIVSKKKNLDSNLDSKYSAIYKELQRNQ